MPDRKHEISSILAEWYRANHRELPWRETRDPYRIWLSEVILQQTRVAQGLSYYGRFTEKYPDVNALAAADPDEVLKLWQGLGYYSRARNLHAAAREVAGGFGGRFPREYAAVRSLPGVGDYTAAAVCSLAYGLPYAVVDGNVYRVLARLFDIDLPINGGTAKKIFAELASELLDPRDPGLHNQSVMEFGALQCTPASPDCGACPLNDRCLALSRGTVALRPAKAPRREPKSRYFNYLHIRMGNRTFVRQREASDIWKNLWEFPLIETPYAVEWDGLCATEEFRVWLGGMADVRLVRTTAMPPHQLTHRTIHARFYELAVPDTGPDLPAGLRGFAVIPHDALGDYAVSRLTDRYLSLSECRTGATSTRN